MNIIIGEDAFVDTFAGAFVDTFVDKDKDKDKVEEAEDNIVVESSVVADMD
jgi:hypothetical protein